METPKLAFWPEASGALIRHKGDAPDRLAAMEVTAHILVEQAKRGEVQCVRCVENALPDDAEVVAVSQSRWQALFLVLRSQEFDLIAPGEEIPLLPDPVFRSERLARAEVMR